MALSAAGQTSTRIGVSQREESTNGANLLEVVIQTARAHLLLNGVQRDCVLDGLDKPTVATCGHYAVRMQPERQMLFLPDMLEFEDHLGGQHFLSEIVSCRMDNSCILQCWRCAKTAHRF
jgi:hypothetical protein